MEKFSCNAECEGCEHKIDEDCKYIMEGDVEKAWACIHNDNMHFEQFISGDVNNFYNKMMNKMTGYSIGGIKDE